MTLPDPLKAVLPRDVARTWTALAPLVPDAAYLGGGTAIAAHLHHRVSRDLDFFYHDDALDLDEMAARLRQQGPFAIARREPGTLNGVFSGTRVQFLHADEGGPQRRLEPTTRVGGLSIAGIGDLLAMKLNAVAGRAELRDYFDLMAIEQQTGRTVEEGLSLFLARYRPDHPASAIEPIVRSLGYFDDLEDDGLLPVDRASVTAYWSRRQPQVLVAVGRFGSGGTAAGP